MRTWRRKLRRILQAVWLEVWRQDPAVDSGRDNVREFAAPDSGAGSEVIGRVTGSNEHTRSVVKLRSADIVRDRDSRAGGPVIAIEARGGGPRPAQGKKLAEYTLTAIRNSMKKLESQGIRPDGIILEPDEYHVLLKMNFDWRDGDPYPSSVTLFGLPVKVQR